MFDKSELTNQVIAEYLLSVETGKASDRQTLVDKHPELRAGLESFFDTYDRMQAAVSTETPRNTTYASGRCVGRYRLDRVIGEGAFGQVWLGFDDELQRPVAVKVQSPDRFRDESETAMFLAEARHAARLDHPHIVPIFDVGRDEDGSIYLVSKFIAGNDLGREMQAQQLDYPQIAWIVATVAGALAHAHQRELIHRDIKPSNILFEAVSRTPFVADFGLAVHSSDDAKESVLAGTPAYMSPEQISGTTLDGRSDVFSLGVVLYELLSGQKPFSGSTRTEILDAVLSEHPLPLRKLDSSIPPVLQKICHQALAKQQAERFSAAEMAAELKKWHDCASKNHDLNATLPLGDVLPRHPSRAKWPWAVAMIVVLATSLAAASFLRSGAADGNNEVTPAEIGTQVSTGPRDDERRIAEAIIRLGGALDADVSGTESHKFHDVSSLSRLPQVPFTINWIMMPRNEQVDDDFLAELQSCRHLQGVDFYSTSITDRGAAHLAGISTLKYVYVHYTDVGDEGAALLAQLPHLERLILRNTQITDETLRHLVDNRTLLRLDVSGTGITDDGLQHLSSLSQLEIINLSDTAVGDDGLKHLTALQRVREFEFSGTRVTNAGLSLLAKWPLRRIQVSDHHLSRSAIKQFQEDHPGCAVRWMQ